MPSAKTHTAVNRQWELLKLIPPRGTITVTALFEKLADNGFKVDRRTVQRDLNDLSRMFPLVDDGVQPPNWSWMPGAGLDLQGITLPEAVSLSLVEDAVRPLLPASMLAVLEPRFEHAREKLKHLQSGHPDARWPNKVASVRADFNLQQPQINPQILKLIQQALIEETQVRSKYYSAHSDKLRELTLNPLAIVQRGQVTYLIATADGYTDVRQYAMHRFHEAEKLEASCQGLQDFDLQAYLNSDALQFGKLEKISLKAWVSAHQARLIGETPLSEDMQLTQQDDGFVVEATVSNTWQLQWWILSQGAGIVVHEPLVLRQKISEMLRQAASAYETEPVPA